MAKPEGHLLVYVLMHEVDRHACQPRPRSTLWIVPFFLIVSRNLLRSSYEVAQILMWDRRMNPSCESFKGSYRHYNLHSVSIIRITINLVTTGFFADVWQWVWGFPDDYSANMWRPMQLEPWRQSSWLWLTRESYDRTHKRCKRRVRARWLVT